MNNEQKKWTLVEVLNQTRRYLGIGFYKDINGEQYTDIHPLSSDEKVATLCWLKDYTSVELLIDDIYSMLNSYKSYSSAWCRLMLKIEFLKNQND